ncbi:CTD nuclear envelope phosphatase 1 homolog isoform X1 [Belonocnema kinseyi]|nr:CTD nuclear envelope phosphatase 1 homolog isoform X1 [Belonocnema kinseyi]
MLKQLQMGMRAFLLIASRVWTCICFLLKKQVRAVSRPLAPEFSIFSAILPPQHIHVDQISQMQPVKYEIFPLSPLSRHRLSIVKRKVLVLDLDETLIHSHHDGVARPTVRPGTPPDFVLKVKIDRHPVRFFVHKRPHVDFFLDIVSQWYELVVFTASMEIYGAAVADKLDNNRGILRRRYYRQHCTPEMGSYTKDLAAICSDLASVFILDNSPGAYRAYPNNAIPIKSWFSDAGDTALLSLLPVLDALRFTQDVRSVLSRNLHLHHTW